MKKLNKVDWFDKNREEIVDDFLEGYADAFSDHIDFEYKQYLKNLK